MQLAPHEVMNTQADLDKLPEGVARIKAPEYWAKGYKGKGVKIAIIDSGCQVDHPDLKDRIIGGRNFTAEDGGDVDKYNDYNGHGTHVAGIIAASQDGRGIVGGAPEASLLILKAMDKKGQGDYIGVTNAIRYATAQQVDVISMSLGGGTDYDDLHKAIDEAIAQGIIIVCAAANSGDGNPLTLEYAFPAYYTEVVSVGAEEGSRQVARFSDSNNQVDLIAPGVNIVSTYLNSGYAALSGTSMAAPHVTGAIALLINLGMQEFGRKLTELELYAQLVRRAISLGLPKVVEGNGMIYLTAPDLLQDLLCSNKI